MREALSEFERRTRDKLARDFGPVVGSALADPNTIELLLNPDGRLWQERLGEPLRCIGHMAPEHAEGVIKTVASHLGKEVTRHSPLLEGELPPDGARFAAQIPPVVAAPTFAIRKPAVRLFRLRDYVEQGSLAQGHCAALEAAVDKHRNILVVGGTGSGKTTLVNGLIARMVEVAPTERLVLLEDTREIQCAAENSVQYHTSEGVDLADLLRTTLRMRPDRILVGEVRGPEALDLLMAWNTGHEGGAATVHANDALSGLLRLEMLVSMNPRAPREIARLVAEAVDVVAFVARCSGGKRQVKEVLEVTGLGPDGYITQPL